MLAVAALIVAKNGIDYLLPWHRLFKTRFGNWLLEKIGAFKITLQYNIKCSSQRLGFCPLETMLDGKEVSVTCVFVDMINFTEYVSSHHSSKESQLFMQDYVALLLMKFLATVFFATGKAWPLKTGIRHVCMPWPCKRWLNH
jgi:hypothetical protein